MENPNLDLMFTPAHFDTSLASTSLSPSTPDGNNINYDYDVFINYCARDVQQGLASHIYHCLQEHGLRVFFDEQERQVGANITPQIERVIQTAPVHIPILSPNYAGSSWCLNELVMMVETESTILPVFYHVHPGRYKTALQFFTHSMFAGQYGTALHGLEEERTVDSTPRYDSDPEAKWRTALSHVSEINGLVLEDFNCDEGKMVNKILEVVLKKLKNRVHDVFINHRGPDVKKNLASHLYYGLSAHGLRVFLDIEELQQGDSLNSQIEKAIQTAFVHIAIFSPGYAESNWCLEELELMFRSGRTIIPVFKDVRPSELRSENGRYAKDLCMLKEKKTVDNQTKQEKQRFDNETVGKWRNCLSHVAKAAEKRGFDLEECDGNSEGRVISGFDLEELDGDEGQLVDQVVKRVLLEEVENRFRN